MRSTDAADYQDLPRAVAVMPKDVPGGYANAPHRHKRGMLLYAATGVAAVTTPAGAWVVPPQRAVWVPAETEHSVRAWNRLAMRAVYVRPRTPRLPRHCCVVPVSALLRELILRAAELPVDYPPRSPAARLMALLLDEIRVLPVLPLHLPQPQDRRLCRICDAIRGAPGLDRTLDQWAKEAGASARTLARLFQDETGMSFGRWRQQARLLEALARFAAGEPVTNVALDLGYQSPSAFTSMFRRTLGCPPTEYFAAG